MEVVLCGLGLAVLSPLLIFIAILIRLSGPGPILFRQDRLGRYGEPFELLKFRSMVHRPAGGGPMVTVGGDRRVTPLGRVLRATKLDELPQLWNVVRGDMSLVGPRPEVPTYAARYPQLFELVLQQRPGITDVCTLQLRNEEQVLAGQADPETYYIERLLPRKLAASIREGWRRTPWRDLRVLVGTVMPGLAVLAPRPDFRPLASLHELTGAQLQAEAELVGRAVHASGYSEPTTVEEPVEVEIGA
ncbi:sugar transferase [bacterium]|nr:sugar transferase [bacterium]